MTGIVLPLAALPDRALDSRTGEAGTPSRGGIASEAAGGASQSKPQ
jgi:hypothetical protein